MSAVEGRPKSASQQAQPASAVEETVYPSASFRPSVHELRGLPCMTSAQMERGVKKFPKLADKQCKFCGQRESTNPLYLRMSYMEAQETIHGLVRSAVWSSHRLCCYGQPNNDQRHLRPSDAVQPPLRSPDPEMASKFLVVVTGAALRKSFGVEDSWRCQASTS